ncbi:MAG: hypothetical protein HFG26_07470 [Provencibacterium sp.]|jgi:hypothetical protein|nr:hypothetical protein [Provencibacterium sp.]
MQKGVTAMPRGRKAVVNYEEEIQKVDMQITRWKKTIDELQGRRRELVEQREQAELETLRQVIQSTGMSVGEIISLVEGAGSPPAVQP